MFFSDGAVVTAVSYITRNAAPPAGTDTPVVGKVKMTQSVRWLEHAINPTSFPWSATLERLWDHFSLVRIN